jgi:hypothetical protein
MRIRYKPLQKPLGGWSKCKLLTVTMVSFSALIYLATLAMSVDAGASLGRWKDIKKTNVPGFFMQDLAETNPTTFDWVCY